MKEKIKNFNFLFKYFWKHGAVFFVLVTITCFITPLFNAVNIYLMKFAMDSVSKDLSYIAIGVVIILGTMLLINIISNLIEVYFGEKLMIRIRSNINKEVLKKINKTDIEHFDSPKFYNNYAWAVDHFVNQSHASARYIWNMISSFVAVSALIALIIVLDYVIIFISVTAVIIGTLLSTLMNKLYFKKNEASIVPHRRINYIKRIFYLKDFSMGLKTTHSKDLLLDKFDDNVNNLSKVADKYRKKITLVGVLENLNSYIFLALTIIYLSYRIKNNSGITYGSFAALVATQTALKSELTKLLRLIPNYQQISLYGGRIRMFFETDSSIESCVNEKTVDDMPLGIEVTDLEFKYSEKPVINNLNLNISPGEKIAIVGKNGIGKTTLVKLLLRLYDPYKGNIKYNNTDLKDVSLEKIRNNIGVAFQKSTQISLTIREQMQFYNPDITDEQILEIFKMIGYDKVMERGNYNLDSFVTREFDSKGLAMSGGESQLLAISRLFTKRFGLLILDEPSASLDPHVEHRLNNIILNDIKNTTVILISHRLSNVRKFDKIYVMSENGISEAGTHDELMSLEKEYYTMFTKQAENYK